MAITLGIDLGTTNSVMAVLDRGEPKIVPNREGDDLTPSVVTLTEDGFLVGKYAKQGGATKPEMTVRSIKRHMGKPDYRVLDRSPIEHAGASQGSSPGVSGSPTNSPSGEGKTTAAGKKNGFTPEEISAQILMKLKRDAEQYLGETVTDAVITVPARFDDRQRKATQRAGKIAGLNVLGLVNEPTAAVLAVLFQQKQQSRTKDAWLDQGCRNLVVVDLSRGTFDVTVMQMEDTEFHVLSTEGDVELGGDDWDDALFGYIKGLIKEQNGVDITSDLKASFRLRETLEQAKIELSTQSTAQVSLPFFAQVDGIPVSLDETLTRAKFEELTAHLLQKLEDPYHTAMRESGLTERKIDEFILVGGATRMPAVQDLFTRLAGRRAISHSQADLAVALGAAISAGIESGAIQDVVLIDVLSLSLGVSIKGDRMDTLLKKNTALPEQATKEYTNEEDYQTSLTVKVYQGERPLVKDCRFLGEFELEGLEHFKRHQANIDVTFRIDDDGVLHVSAVETSTGVYNSLKIHNVDDLSEEEIEAMQEGAHRHEAENRRALDSSSQEEGAAINFTDLGNRALNAATSGKYDKFTKQCADLIYFGELLMKSRIKGMSGARLNKAAERIVALLKYLDKQDKVGLVAAEIRRIPSIKALL